MKHKKLIRKDKAEAAKTDGVYCVVRDEHIPFRLCSKLRKRPGAPCGNKGCKSAREVK